MGPAGTHDQDGLFLVTDLTPYNASLKHSFRKVGSIVILTELVVAVTWIAIATANFKFLAVTSWAAASMHFVRITLAIVSVVAVMHPERIDTYAVVHDSESRAAQIIRIFGLTTPYTPMMFYGLLAIAVQPALILGVVIFEALLLWHFWAPGLLIINIVFGIISVAHGFVAYQAWQTFGVIHPRERALQNARNRNRAFT